MSMKPSDFVVMILLFSGIVTGLSLFTVDVVESAGGTITDTSSLAQIQQINAKINDTYTSVLETKLTGIESVDALFGIAKGAWTTLTTIALWLPTMIMDVLGAVTEFVPMPSWLISIIIGSITFALSVALIEVLTQRKI